MDVFFGIDEAVVNISKVRKISTGWDTVEITFDDGETETYRPKGGPDEAVDRIGRTILQVIPCKASFYNVYKDIEIGYFHERVDYLALCADGCVRSFVKPDSFFALADEAPNFVGCFGEDKLSDYPMNNSQFY